MLRRVMSQGPACLLIGSVGPCKRGTCFERGFSCRAVSSSTGTLDGDPIYYQELKLILSSDLRGVRDRVATTRVRQLEFSEFPIF